MSTTMAFVRVLTQLARDKTIGRSVVPIVADGPAPSAWKACSVRSASIRPRAALRTAGCRPAHVLQGGQGADLAGRHQRSGRMAWIAAGTVYSNHGVNMMPFYIYYSMFGFQRIGDLAWAAGDLQARAS